MITICPHCQTPVKPSQDGEARCPGCGFLVLPQPGRLCPSCHKYTLASLDHCQHCHAPLPQTEPESHDYAPFAQHARPSWISVVRALIVIAFSVMCMIGLYNFVQDRQQKEEAIQNHRQVKTFAYHYSVFQKQFMKRFSDLLSPQDDRIPLSTSQLISLQQALQNDYIPQCRTLLEELDRLPEGARAQLLNPEQLQHTLLEQLKLMNFMQDSLKRDLRIMQNDSPDPPINI